MTEPLVISYSRIKSWRFCRQAYFYKYVKELIPKRKPKALKIGSLVHSSLEMLTKDKDWKLPIAEAEKEYNKMFLEEKEYYGNFPEEASRIIEGYQKAYPVGLLKFSCAEQEFGPIPLTDVTALKFKIDKLAEPTSGPMKGKLFLFETKTGRKIPKDEIRIWDLQTVIYIWGLRMVGKNISGIIWDYLRTKAPTVPLLLKSGELSKNQNIDTDYETYFKAIKDNGLKVQDYKEFLDNLKNNTNNFYRRVTLPVTDSVIDSIVKDMVVTSLEIFYLADIPVKTISGFTCPRCDYNSICYAKIRSMDEDYIIKTEFMNQSKEVSYNVMTDEEDSD